MLIETFEYAVTNRDKILSRIDFKRHEATMGRAKASWNGFDPVDKEGSLVGIDSSWNCAPYQGFYLYAVDAVSILGSGAYLVTPSFDVNLGTLNVPVEGDNRAGGEKESVSNPALALESMGMEYEFEQIRACLEKKVELILVDGSILARFYDRRQGKEAPFYEFAKELMKEKSVAFLSKTSISNITLKGVLGDIFYYDRVSSQPGYSEPYLDRSGVTISYLRLTDFSPCIKLEAPGEIKSKEIEELMGTLKESSVDGYPYVLRLAHEKGKISHEEMGRIANLLGLNTEIGGRQILGE